MIGPDGGNVRCLSYDPSDPNRILLGTSAGQLFVSRDGGSSWAPFAHLGTGDDLVIDHIVFDPTNPKIIYAAGWGLYHDDEGDVFRSDDGGATWRALAGGARQVDSRLGDGAERSQHPGHRSAGWRVSVAGRRARPGRR